MDGAHTNLLKRYRESKQNLEISEKGIENKLNQAKITYYHYITQSCVQIPCKTLEKMKNSERFQPTKMRGNSWTSLLIISSSVGQLLKPTFRN